MYLIYLVYFTNAQVYISVLTSKNGDKTMELEDINKFIEEANEEQLKTIGFLAQWMGENGAKYCNCSVKCAETCKLAQTMFGAFQKAGERLA